MRTLDHTADDPVGYVVVTFNQASGQPSIDDPTGTITDDLEDARALLADQRRATAAVGRRERHALAVVCIVEDGST